MSTLKGRYFSQYPNQHPCYPGAPSIARTCLAVCRKNFFRAKQYASLFFREYPAKKKNNGKMERKGEGGRDVNQAYKEAGLWKKQAMEAKETGYTWHKEREFETGKGKSTRKVVSRTGHEATYPHAGSVEQFEKHFGVKYGTPEAVDAVHNKRWLKGRKIGGC